MNFADIENTLITTLKAAMPYLRFCDTYQGQLDDDNIMLFARNFPAALIYLERAKYTDRGYPLKWKHIEVTILVCDKNLRGNKNARQGDSTQPGTYKMLDDVYTALSNKDLGLAILPFDVDKEEALINTGKLSVYAAGYKSQFSK